MRKRGLQLLFVLIPIMFLILGYILAKDVDEEETNDLKVNVTSYPYTADPNGVNDSSDVIQRAIDSVSENGGGTVYIPEGTYRLKSSLVLKSNIVLRGSGKETLLKGDFTKAGSPIITNKVDVQLNNVVLTKFRLDRSGIHTQHGILLGNVTDFLAEEIEIVSEDDRPGGALGISAFDVYAKYPSKNIRVKNSRFYYSGNFGVQYGNVENGFIENNRFINGYREVIGVEPFGKKGKAQNIKIEDNFIYNKKVTVNGTPTGKLIITNSSGGSATNILVRGNVVQEETESGNSLPGIAVYGSKKVEIIGNTVTNTGGSGILITSTYGYDPEDLLISENKVLNAGLRSSNASGIKLVDTSNSLVKNNIVSGSKHFYGILEEKSSKGNSFQGNQLFGNRNPIKSTSVE